VIYGMDSGVCIINYGMGNLGSVLNAFSFLGHNAVISANPQTIASADAYVLPGVGAFGEAMANLKRTGLVEILAEQVLERKKPFLGICLGLQLLAEDSQEKGFEAGLGWIDGHVVAIPAGSGVRVPHVGWSEVSPVDQTFFTRVADDATFYFDHSFHLVCDPGLVAAKCDHGMPMVAAIRRDNIFATQFHPEKSQKSGLKLLRNFLNFCAAGKG
tara:strand:- start:43 stop:684 length:642 start_codon:yes stop_codon:yes gene_type:complete